MNFFQVVPGVEPTIKMRTYERGVEAETDACGTGSAACVISASFLGLLQRPEAPVLSHGGTTMRVTYDNVRPFLLGPATLCYEGTLNLQCL